MKRPDMRGAKRLFALAATAALMAACGGESSEGLLASAKGYIDKGDHKAAIIQLKSALQKGDSGEARFLLGKALMASGDARSAEVELGKSLDLKVDPQSVAPLLAQALLELGKGKDAVERFGTMELKEPAAQASLKTTLAWARASAGDTTAAVASADQALAAVPGHPGATLFKARVLLSQRDIDGGLKLIEQVLTQAPKDHDALLMKGDVLARGKNDPAGAALAYEQAVAARPNSRSAHSGLVMLAFAARDWDGAAKRLEAMKKVLPADAQTRYLQAHLAMSRGDLKAARELADQLLKVAPEHPGVLQLAGGIEFQQRAHLQAQAHLHKALTIAPHLRLARVTLAQSYARTGQPAKTLATLQPLLQREGGDAEALSIAGEAYLQTGDAAAAEDAFNRAAKINPADPRSRTALALMRLSKGDADAAFDQLESIAEADKGTAADLTLISAHLRRAEFDAALKAIDRLEKKSADKPLPAHLRGAALLGKKQRDAARQSFEQALKIDPTYFPSIERLAAMDLGDKKDADAQRRFEALLKAVPGHVEATGALVQLRNRAGANPDEVAALINDAIKAHPTEPAPRLLLVAHHLSGKRNDRAVSAAQDAVTAIPDNPQLLDALGRAQMVVGDTHQAIATFNKMAALQPESPLGLLRAADAQAATKSYDAARQSLKRAQGVAPGSVEVAQRQVAVELAAGQPAQALTAAREVQTRNPKSGLGHALEGDVEAYGKKWDAAAAAYRTSLKTQPTTPVAVKLHTVLVRADKAADAKALAAKWQADHPTDLVFVAYLADSAMVRKDYPAAEALYQQILKAQPNEPRALNNMAWIKVQTKAPGALDYARKAHDLRPDSAAIADTLALALLADNKTDEALALLQKAATAEPGNLPVKLSLAKAYLQAGQKDKAKEALEQLKAAGDKFPQQDEVGKLLASI
jgi:putative PEP-CTERM system TPR-repeat lipoprotein